MATNDYLVAKIIFQDHEDLNVNEYKLQKKKTVASLQEWCAGQVSVAKKQKAGYF